MEFLEDFGSFHVEEQYARTLKGLGHIYNDALLILQPF